MDEMTLRVPVTIKSKVTEDLKKTLVAQLQQQMTLVDQDLQQLEFQAKSLLSEQAKMDAQGLVNLRSQIEERKQQLVSIKTEVAGQLKETEKLEIGSEIVRGQIEQSVVVRVGDDFNKLMGMEILVEDGKILAFRN